MLRKFDAAVCEEGRKLEQPATLPAVYIILSYGSILARPAVQESLLAARCGRSKKSCCVYKGGKFFRILLVDPSNSPPPAMGSTHTIFLTTTTTSAIAISRLRDLMTPKFLSQQASTGHLQFKFHAIPIKPREERPEQTSLLFVAKSARKPANRILSRSGARARASTYTYT